MEKNLDILADEIVSGFLGGGGNLQELSRKMAEDNSLNATDINNLAQIVNREAQIRVYSEKGPTGAFEFDMVNPDRITSQLNSDFGDRVPREKVASGSISGMDFLKFAEDDENETGTYRTRDRYFREALARLKFIEEDLGDEISKNACDIEETHDRIYKEFKDAALSDDRDLSELLGSIMINEPGLAKVASYVAREVVRDLYDQKSLPDSVKIHENPVHYDKLVGGNSVVKELNTLVKQHDSMADAKSNIMRIREHVRYTVENISQDMGGVYNVEL